MKIRDSSGPRTRSPATARAGTCRQACRAARVAGVGAAVAVAGRQPEPAQRRHPGADDRAGRRGVEHPRRLCGPGLARPRRVLRHRRLHLHETAAVVRHLALARRCSPAARWQCCSRSASAGRASVSRATTSRWRRSPSRRSCRSSSPTGTGSAAPSACRCRWPRRAGGASCSTSRRCRTTTSSWACCC